MQYALLAYGSQRTKDGPVEAVMADVLARPGVTGWARLHADESATTVRNGEGRLLLTDGPFIETKEFLAGIIVVEADNSTVRWLSRRTCRTPGAAVRSRCGPSSRRCVMALDGVFREHWARVLATLVGIFGDIELAEEAAQEAFAIAAERWPRDGEPDHPVGWLISTARNRAIDYFAGNAC